MKNKIIFTITILFLAFSASAQCTVATTLKGFEHPESVTAHKDYLYVSNVGDNIQPLTKNGDGYISKLDRKTGEVIEKKFITGLNAPKGLYVKRNCLYIADVDKVVGYSLKDGKKEYEADLSPYGVQYANDITRAVGGLYVSSTDQNKIYKIKKNGDVKEIELKNQNLNNVNGIYRRPLGRVFVANFGDDGKPNGNVGCFGLIRKKYKTLKENGINDGLVSRRGKLYITDWVTKEDGTGRVTVLNKWTGKLTQLDLPMSISGPSDLFIDRKYNRLWIPAMTENKIVSLDLDNLIQEPFETKTQAVSMK